MKLWDMSDMYKLINEYPRQFERGFRIAEQINLPQMPLNEVIIVAVGHDAAIAEIVQDLFSSHLAIPIKINRELNHTLPASTRTLVINLAVTHFPEEMANLAKQYYEDGANITTITTGGAPEIFARDRHLPLILLDNSLPEWKFRMGSGLMIAILTQVLISAGVLNHQVRSSLLQATIELENMYLTKLGEKIAKAIMPNSSLLLYSPNFYLGIANLIKHLANTLLQLPCFVGRLSDYKYGETYGFAGKNWSKFLGLIIQPTQEVSTQISFIQKNLATRKIDSFIWELEGQNQIEKSLAAIMLFYWTIYWLLKTD